MLLLCCGENTEPPAALCAEAPAAAAAVSLQAWEPRRPRDIFRKVCSWAVVCSSLQLPKVGVLPPRWRAAVCTQLQQTLPTGVLGGLPVQGSAREWHGQVQVA